MIKKIIVFLKFNEKNKIWTILILALIVSNTFFLGVNAFNKYRTRYPVYYEPGYQFINFKDKLKNIKRAGYLTNKDMNRQINDQFFLQAQYFLAPTIFELNNPAHEYSILDYQEQIFVFYMVKKLNASPLVDSYYGQTLIKRKSQ